mgnify:CR=1 FL=1
MDESLKLDEIHHLILNIAKVFHNICVEERIPYYMLYGTMLGAVRHKGFIPWDDDMDFGVEHKYYNKLVCALKTKLPQRYKCLTRYDRRGAIGGFLKIEDTHTVYHTKNRKREEDYIGVFIDIFLLYPSNEDKNWLSRSGLIKLCQLVQVYRFSSKNSPFWAVLLNCAVKVFFFWLERPSLINFYETHLLKHGGDCLTTYASIYNFKDIIQRGIYGEPVLYRFEDTLLYGVNNALGYLPKIYGNYMALPPVEKRRVHTFKVTYK